MALPQPVARSGQALRARGSSRIKATSTRALDAAAASEPDDARAWETLGALALDRRDYRRAEEAHKALVRVERANLAAWLRLGAVLARQQKLGEAREAIARARAHDPKAPVDAQLLAFLDQKGRGRPDAR